jgi:hypothetical protein
MTDRQHEIEVAIILWLLVGCILVITFSPGELMGKKAYKDQDSAMAVHWPSDVEFSASFEACAGMAEWVNRIEKPVTKEMLAEKLSECLQNQSEANLILRQKSISKQSMK